MILMSLAGVALPAQASATPRDMANCCAQMKNRCMPAQGRQQRDCCQQRIQAPQPAALVAAAEVSAPAPLAAMPAAPVAGPVLIQVGPASPAATPPTSPPFASNSILRV